MIPAGGPAGHAAGPKKQARQGLSRVFIAKTARNPYSTHPFGATPYRYRFRSSTLANTKQAKKRARQADAHRDHNATLRSMVRSYIKKVVKAIGEGKKADAETAYKEAVPVIDRMADKGLLHRNKAARHKSRLNAHIKAMKA